jgi:hypothetical protein
MQELRDNRSPEFECIQAGDTLPHKQIMLVVSINLGEQQGCDCDHVATHRLHACWYAMVNSLGCRCR